MKFKSEQKKLIIEKKINLANRPIAKIYLQ